MRVVYVLERIKESRDWPKGARIYANRPCRGWRTVDIIHVK